MIRWVDILYHLLFISSLNLPQGLFLGPGLSLEGGLHGVEGARVVLLGVVELLLLLLDAAVDLLPHLRSKSCCLQIKCLNNQIFLASTYRLNCIRKIILRVRRIVLPFN